MSRGLVLLPSVPDPPDAGARLRNLFLLRTLGAEHELDAIAFGSEQERARLSALVGHATLVPPPPSRSAARRGVDLARTTWPDMALRLWSPAFAREVAAALSRTRYDFVQAEGIEMARYLMAAPPRARVYDAHNAEFMLQRRATETAGSLAARAYSRLQWRRLERFERAVVRSSGLTLAVSQHDANQLLALTSEGQPGHVEVVPNAIDNLAFPFRCPEPDDPPNLLFVGKLDFRPNVDAVRWLVEQVIARVGSTARLFAVGAAPPAWLVRAGQHDDRIVVTGYVPDERPYLARSLALVLPVRMGGGSRLKALVAMASGVPVISTRLGMEGLEAEPGEHFLRAETADEWTACIQRLIGDIGLRRRLASSGRALVKQRYDWPAVAADVRAVYAAFLE